MPIVGSKQKASKPNFTGISTINVETHRRKFVKSFNSTPVPRELLLCQKCEAYCRYKVQKKFPQGNAGKIFAIVRLDVDLLFAAGALWIWISRIFLS
jgi:hypothetical protein